MRTIVIGCNHRTALIEIRERLAFDRKAAADALRGLRRRFPCCEAVIVSTCNRTELYVARPIHGHPRIEEAIDFLASCRGLAANAFSRSVYHYEDIEAIRHLFRVVSSLDSMVLGDSQILAQVKEAVAVATEVGMIGSHLQTLFQRAFAAAKEIHTRTDISGGRTSVGGAAAEFARQIFSRFDDKTVLMIGAGEMGEVTLQHILEMGPRRVLVANRTPAHAEALLERLAARTRVPGEVVPMDALLDHLTAADIVISTTAAPEPILNRQPLADLPVRRKYRPLLMIDIAVPRNVDPAVGELDNVFLYNIDDLQSVTEANAAAREKQLAQCHQIIEAHVADFRDWQRSRDVGPTIAALRDRLTQIGQQELSRVMPKLSAVSDRDRELLDQMLHRIVQKILHGPAKTLHDKSGTGGAQVYAETLRNMFELKDDK